MKNLYVLGILLSGLVLGSCTKEEDPAPGDNENDAPELVAELTVEQENEAKFFFRSETNGQRILWDFGDGTKAEGKTTYHTFQESGTYTVTLTVEKIDGNYVAEYEVNVDINTMFLVTRSWIVEQATANGAPIDFLLGALYTYRRDGTYSAGQVNLTWKFNEDQTVIISAPGLSYELNMHIKKLDMNTMVLEYLSSDNKNYRMVFSAAS